MMPMRENGTAVAAESGFEFGRNWRRFLDVVDERHVSHAERSLKELLEVESLAGKTFLDVGSGSGLSSLAARRLGARVHSFDLDPESVACTRWMKDRYYPGDAGWTVETGSALDGAYLGGLGRFDLVYSWGVLHHTGAMWQALANVVPLVRPGGLLFVAIYNHQGGPTRRWLWIKKLYNRTPPWLRFLIVIPSFVRMWGKTFVRDTLLGNPLRTWREYLHDRGMSPWRDVTDWVGGYPFEAALAEDIFHFYRDRGFVLQRLKTRCGRGCNEFVFRLAAGGGEQR